MNCLQRWGPTCARELAWGSMSAHWVCCLQANGQGKDQGGDNKRGDALERALDADDLDSLEARQRVVQTAVGPSGDPEELLKRIRARFDRCVVLYVCIHVMLAFRLSHKPVRVGVVPGCTSTCAEWHLYVLWCRVGLELPTVEVRFEGVQVETEVFRETSRNLPSLYNTLRNSVEVRMLVLAKQHSNLWLHRSS